LDPKRDLPAHASGKVAGEVDADPAKSSNSSTKEESAKEEKKEDEDKKSSGWGEIFHKHKHSPQLTNYDCKYSYTRKQCEPVEHCKYKYQVYLGIFTCFIRFCCQLLQWPTKFCACMHPNQTDCVNCLSLQSV
jgi:hypothetical protein